MYKVYCKPETDIMSVKTEATMIMDSTGDEKPEIFESNETTFDEDWSNSKRSLWDN